MSNFGASQKEGGILPAPPGLEVHTAAILLSVNIVPFAGLPVNRLADTYKVNLHWFLTGQGPSGLDKDTVVIELLRSGSRHRTGQGSGGLPRKTAFPDTPSWPPPPGILHRAPYGARFPSGTPVGRSCNRGQHDKSSPL